MTVNTFQSSRHAKRYWEIGPADGALMIFLHGLPGIGKTAFPNFSEHRVQRDRGSVYVRGFPGTGPALVVLHGFPDNSHIYDDLIPHLVSAGP